MRNTLTQTLSVCATVGVLAFVTGCQSNDQAAKSTTAKAAPAAVTVATPPAAATTAATTATAPAATKSIIRIKAGASEPFKDTSGNVWQADSGFEGGDVIAREGIEIGNTKEAGLYRAEHYGMSSFSCTVPNGKYTAKLHFAETYDGITGAGERVFSFNVQGREFKDFDVFVKAGGSNKAYVETVPVEVTNGKFTITFTSNVENPEINAIELIPQS
jgi:hypothetical protein